MGINSGMTSKRGLAAVAPAALLLGAVVLFGRPAAAQQALTVEQIQACLCEDQAMTVLRQRNDAAKARYDSLTQRENTLSQQIDQLQSTITVNDLAAQDQLRELIDIRASISQDRMRNALPAWQAAARQLDAVVQDYNLKCTRPMYKMDLQRAQANLSCPPVP
jgi:cell division protein FtsB